MFVKSCSILGGPPEEDGGGNATWVEGESVFIIIQISIQSSSIFLIV